MKNFGEDIEEEISLARYMKDNVCDSSGKEKDPKTAGKILHKIGLIYRKRSPDKISLIKSAGLLNAAIVRNPLNLSQVKSDLSRLCQHVLEESKSNNQNADLIEKGKEVKASITVLRNAVKEFLKAKVPKMSENASKKSTRKVNTQKIAAIQQINKTIAYHYTKTMAEISQFCENVVGKAPCKYAVVGMGSLAREEITPYSDFEHIILIADDKKYKSYIEYFKWFSVIFHIIILNVQETIVPSLNIFSLNDKESRLGDWYYDAVTPRGVSFDGMMPHACKFPLGRQQRTKHKQFTTELIKPVNEMLEYLSSKADLKNGYHLADILTKTCFVFGNEEVYKKFKQESQAYKDTKSQIETISDIKFQVTEDLNNFSTRFRLTNLKSKDTINIKQLVYRSTTIFIQALARKHNVSANSCFDVIDEMMKSKKITQTTAYKLRCAIAVACEMRLRVYAHKESQCDNAISLRQDGIECFLNIVGLASTINYFQIAYCLQCEVAKQLNFTKLHFYSDSQLINFTIGLAFGLRDLTTYRKKLHRCCWSSNQFDFDACIEKLETQIKPNRLKFKSFSKKMAKSIFRKQVVQFPNNIYFNVKQIKFVAEKLFTAEIFDEAIEFYKQLLVIYENKLIDHPSEYDVALLCYKIGHCLNELKQAAAGLQYFARALAIIQNLALDVDRDSNIAAIVYRIGRCHFDLHNYDESLKNLNRALEIYQRTNLNSGKDKSLDKSFFEIPGYHFDLHDFHDALLNLSKALEVIDQNVTRDTDTDSKIAATLHSIGCCHIDLHNHDKALTHLNQALEIKQTIRLNANTNKEITKVLHAFGLFEVGVLNYDKECSYFNQMNRSIAETFLEIGCCHINLRNYNEAMKNLNQALEILQDTSIDLDNDLKLAAVQRNIGQCLTGLNQCDNAWKYLKQSLQISQNKTLNVRKDTNVAVTMNYMGECLMAKQLYPEALSYLQQARQIFKTQTNAEKDPNLTLALQNIEICLMRLQENADV